MVIHLYTLTEIREIERKDVGNTKGKKKKKEKRMDKYDKDPATSKRRSIA